MSYFNGKKILTNYITVGGGEELVKVTDIVDNLTSTETNKPLSAYQGNVLKALIDTLSQCSFKVVSELPPTQEAQTNVIYLVPKTSTGAYDSYNEYIYIDNSGFELIGSTDIDLSSYVPITRKVNNKALDNNITIYSNEVPISSSDSRTVEALLSDLYSVKADKELLYNLGAFDTVSGNVITRKTGYANLEDLNWNYTANTNRYTSASLSTLIKKATYDSSLTEIIILCPNVKTTFADDVYSGNIGIAVGVGGTIYYKDTNTSQTTKPKGIIQYELATSYTEKIIEGHPLITLDSQGSQWLKDEWEKGLNLLDYNSRIVNKAINTNGQIYDYSGAYYIKVSLKPNTTYNASGCIDATSGSVNLFTYDGTFIRRIRSSNLDSKGNFITDSNVSYALCDNLANITQPMLVEGSHAYPYQEYNGGIVRQKQLDDKANKSDVFTKYETQALIDSVTTGGVELTNYYTKTETENKLANKVPKTGGEINGILDIGNSSNPNIPINFHSQDGYYQLHSNNEMFWIHYFLNDGTLKSAFMLNNQGKNIVIETINNGVPLTSANYSNYFMTSGEVAAIPKLQDSDISLSNSKVGFTSDSENTKSITVTINADISVIRKATLTDNCLGTGTKTISGAVMCTTSFDIGFTKPLTTGTWTETLTLYDLFGNTVTKTITVNRTS